MKELTDLRLGLAGDPVSGPVSGPAPACVGAPSIVERPAWPADAPAGDLMPAELAALIDEDPARAETLPARCYTDPAWLARERAAIFARTWQLAGRLDQVAEPGDFASVEVAGEPLVLVRDEERRLRALSAVCRHRAGPVACGAGRRRSLQCAYHGWTYGLDGRLRAAPEFDGVAGFRRDALRLPELPAGAFGPLVLVNLDPSAAPLDEALAEVRRRTAHLDLSGLRLGERRDYVVRCNWKVYVDNYLEGYHIPLVHPRLHRELDYDGYRTETLGNCSLQIGPLRRGQDPDRRYARAEDQAQDALYFWVFPNLMLNLYPDNVSTNLILPLGPDRTLTIFEWLFKDEGQGPALTPERRAAIEFSDEIQREDIAICEAVQRGLGSRTYDRGRYSARRENGVHHFHRLWAQALAAT